MAKDEPPKGIINPEASFKTGWDKAGSDGAITPELQKAYEELGVHPDRTQDYANAVMKHAVKKGEKPSVGDFKEPKIISLDSRRPSQEGPEGSDLN